VVDFKKRLAGKKVEKPVDPVKLYDTSDSRLNFMLLKTLTM